MKRIFAILGIVIMFAPAFAQGDMSTVEAWQPKFINDNNGATKSIAKGQSWQQWCENKLKTEGLGESTGRYWIVYSDREGNPTYKDATCSTPTGKVLGFGEKLYVAKLQNGAAYVYSSNHTQSYPKIRRADFKGWVPIENLLMWDVCPKSKNMVYQKALVVYNPSEDNSATGPQAETKFLLAPKAGAQPSTTDANSLDILFVMKKVVSGDKAYYLLSNQYNCRDINSSLYGWLPSEFVNPWDYRLALEPTYKSLVVKKYTAANLKPAFYSRYQEANRYFENGQKGKPLYLYENFGTRRMDPLIMRYPILDSSENHYIYQVAVTASLDGKGGGKDYQERKAEAQRRIDELNRRQSHINIIFVIDATNSMKEFYPALVNALKSIQSYEFFNNSDTRSLIKFGAVLYRDAKREPEYFALNHDVDKLVSFLNVKTTPDGKDDRVDMFNGIETALDCKKMGYSPEHSNYIILLGDAGNVEKTKDGLPWHKASVPLAEKLAANRINFLAYQIRNTGAGVYADFVAQIRKMQQDLTNNYIQLTHADMDYSRTGNVIKLVRKSSGEGDDLPVYSRIEYAEEGETKEASIITGSIVAHVQNFYDVISQRIVKYNRLADGGYRFGDDAEEEAVREELRLAGWDEAKIDRTVRFMKQGGVAKFNTFAPVMTKQQALSTRYPIYDFVLFFSGDELTDLIRNLDKIVNNERGDIRKMYQDAVSTMGKAMLGEFSQSEINSMDINELMGQIYGVPVNITTKELRINEISEAKEETVRELMVGFKQKLEQLRDISQGGEVDNKSRFERNGMAYYWIPIEVMPGFTITME